MAINSNEIMVWDILVCGKKCVLTGHEVTHTAASPFVSCLWTAEGSLFVLDTLGNVYMVFSLLITTNFSSFELKVIRVIIIDHQF